MKRIRVITLVILLAALIALTTYRYFYGTWNPLTAPDRINVYGRRYYTSHRELVLTGSKKPTYPICSANLVAGKLLYMNSPKGKYVPTVIYLYIGSGKYQVYELSGGP